MRVCEYYAEILGDNHSEYPFIKTIPKRIFGYFLLRKIERDGYLIEHLASKKQLRLSNECTSFTKVKLVENETVLTISLVQWGKDVWHAQGGCIYSTINKIAGKDNFKHIFDDENMKMEYTHNLEKIFLEITRDEYIVYFHGSSEYSKFQGKIIQKQMKITDSEMRDKKLDKLYDYVIEKEGKKSPFEEDEVLGVFFNPNRGIEVYRGEIIACLSDKKNPYQDPEKYFDLCNLITIEIYSKEFVNYIIENKLLKYCLHNYEESDMFSIIFDNLDFLLRFYRRSRYYSKPEVIINH